MRELTIEAFDEMADPGGVGILARGVEEDEELVAFVGNERGGAARVRAELGATKKLRAIDGVDRRLHRHPRPAGTSVNLVGGGGVSGDGVGRAHGEGTNVDRGGGGSEEARHRVGSEGEPHGEGERDDELLQGQGGPSLSARRS